MGREGTGDRQRSQAESSTGDAQRIAGAYASAEAALELGSIVLGGAAIPTRMFASRLRR